MATVVLRSPSDAVGPEKLLRDSTFGDLAQVFEEGAFLQVNVHAVAKAVVCLAHKAVLVDSEGVLDFTTA